MPDPILISKYFCRVPDSIITGEPHDFVREIHTRMPVILPEEHHESWLSDEAGKEVLVPFPARQMKAWPMRGPAESELLSYLTGAILALHSGTLHRTIRTKDAAIAGFGAEQRLTANAFVEELAGVSWHRFAFGEAANRTYQHGFQKKLAHARLSALEDLI